MKGGDERWPRRIHPRERWRSRRTPSKAAKAEAVRTGSVVLCETNQIFSKTLALGSWEALFQDEFVRRFQGIARPAKRKLEAVNAASRLEDLTVPPSNRLEKLKGDLKDFHSIRINDQWRVIFKWLDGEPHEVRIVDYH